MKISYKIKNKNIKSINKPNLHAINIPFYSLFNNYYKKIKNTDQNNPIDLSLARLKILPAKFHLQVWMISKYLKSYIASTDMEYEE